MRWTSWALVVCLPLAGCDCGTTVLGRTDGGDAATGRDAGLPHGDGGGFDAAIEDARFSDDVIAPPQPCAADIHRVSVTLPPVIDVEQVDLASRAELHGDEVLVARTDIDLPGAYDVPGGSQAMFSRVDAFDGHVIASGQAGLGASSDYAPEPRGFHVLADGSTDVLYVHQDLTAGEIMGFAADGTMLGRRFVTAPPGTLASLSQEVVAPTTEGWVFYLGGAFAEITDADATLTMHPVDLPPTSCCGSGDTSMAAVPGSVWLATANVTEVLVQRYDVRDYTRPAAEAHVSIDMASFVSVQIAGTSDGGALLSAQLFGVPFTAATHSFVWLAADGSVAGRFDEWPAESVALLGAAGALPMQAIAEIRNGGGDPSLYFAVASAAGTVSGAERPLVNGLSYRGSITAVAAAQPDSIGQRSDGAFTIAFWGPGLNLISLCGGP